MTEDTKLGDLIILSWGASIPAFTLHPSLQMTSWKLAQARDSIVLHSWYTQQGPAGHRAHDKSPLPTVSWFIFSYISCTHSPGNWDEAQKVFPLLTQGLPLYTSLAHTGTSSTRYHNTFPYLKALVVNRRECKVESPRKEVWIKDNGIMIQGGLSILTRKCHLSYHNKWWDLQRKRRRLTDRGDTTDERHEDVEAPWQSAGCCGAEAGGEKWLSEVSNPAGLIMRGSKLFNVYLAEVSCSSMIFCSNNISWPPRVPTCYSSHWRLLRYWPQVAGSQPQVGFIEISSASPLLSRGFYCRQRGKASVEIPYPSLQSNKKVLLLIFFLSNSVVELGEYENLGEWHLQKTKYQGLTSNSKVFNPTGEAP